ncbi:MAG: hypothetical protein ACJ77V_07730 [Chloroflexota bacterium]
MDLEPIIRVGLGFAAFVGILAVVRIAIVPDGVGFGDLFVGIRGDLDRARGVQEEEPVRWRPECLRPRRAGSSTTPSSTTDRGAEADPAPARSSGGLSAARRSRG